MKTARVLLSLVLFVLPGCGADGDALRADVALVPGVPEAGGAISDRPIDTGVFQGWYGQGSALGHQVTARPGSNYVVVSGAGCTLPERSELVRTGDDLHARFTEEDEVDCAQADGWIAQFTVSADAVRGVRTIGGKPPLAPDGPGTLEEFIPLGSRPVDLRHAELGTDQAQELYRALERAGSTNLVRAGATLESSPPQRRRGFAFVLTGCAELAAVLVVDRTALTAKATGGEGTNCVTANHFLATFTIDRDRIPPDPVLSP
ncbi:hypothetical protein [Amycolatopsis sp. YIM 10]|uniref:hypothetical protein n=1 Tax=Amycolatopsis sp. YIM 10 TaxID=2653857 RepID=UPI0012A78A65|nr:hypothetical protein [Amycolatopsis sp. YIM 10]QFU94331.1 hypothetical protein YIM_46025 [Amycolatopsis sp. YIM 10]